MDADETWQLVKLAHRLGVARDRLGKVGAMYRADSAATSVPTADGARAEAIIQEVMGEMFAVARALADAAFDGPRRRKSAN
ncbi:MAG: hypothetical protein ACLQB4_05925 [Beijerinckiaceae bacterium]